MKSGSERSLTDLREEVPVRGNIRNSSAHTVPAGGTGLTSGRSCGNTDKKNPIKFGGRENSQTSKQNSTSTTNESMRMKGNQNQANRRAKRLSANRLKAIEQLKSVLSPLSDPTDPDVKASFAEPPPPTPAPTPSPAGEEDTPPMRVVQNFSVGKRFTITRYTDQFKTWFDSIQDQSRGDVSQVRPCIQKSDFSTDTTSKKPMKFLRKYQDESFQSLYRAFPLVPDFIDSIGLTSSPNPLGLDFRTYMGSIFEYQMSHCQQPPINAIDPMNKDEPNSAPREMQRLTIYRQDFTLHRRTQFKCVYSGPVNYALLMGAMKYGVANVGLTDKQLHARTNNFLRMSSTYTVDHDIQSFSEEQLVHLVATSWHSKTRRKMANLGLFWKAPDNDASTDTGSERYLRQRSDLHSRNYREHDVLKQTSIVLLLAWILAVLYLVLHNPYLILQMLEIFISACSIVWDVFHHLCDLVHYVGSAGLPLAFASVISAASRIPTSPNSEIGFYHGPTLNLGNLNSWIRFLASWRDEILCDSQVGVLISTLSSKTNVILGLIRSLGEFIPDMIYSKSTPGPSLRQLNHPSTNIPVSLNTHLSPLDQLIFMISFIMVITFSIMACVIGMMFMMWLVRRVVRVTRIIDTWFLNIVFLVVLICGGLTGATILVLSLTLLRKLCGRWNLLYTIMSVLISVNIIVIPLIILNVF